MESTTESKPHVLLYTEQTPNPETLKFVSNRMLYRGIAEFKNVAEAENWSLLATELFHLEFVQGIYISNNFVTITKKPDFDWQEIMVQTKDFIKKYLETDREIVKDTYEAFVEQKREASSDITYSDSDAELVKRIKEIIIHYVRPAVEMDGGNIEFKSYQNGVVTVMMQGSCSGCPSCTVTLKAGIEGLLKRMVPEVTEVVAEAQ